MVTWDETKRLSNIREHGLDFTDRDSVFDGPITTREDDRLDYGEQRINLSKMKHASTSPTFSAEQIKAAIKAAPKRVHDPDSPYDPNDQGAVAAYFKDAVVVRGGGYQAVRKALAAKRRPGQRGPGKRPAKEVINIRLSPDVLLAFRATGDGWQTRVDGALRDWLKRNAPRTIKARRIGEET